MAAWHEERGDRTTESMMYPGERPWFIGERLLERIKTMTPTRTKTKQVDVRNPETMEVPVRRIAEYIPASFVACDDGEEDILNDPESRIYKVDDDSFALSYNAGLLKFNCHALKLVLDRLDDMTPTDLAEVLGLNDDEDDLLDEEE